MKVRLYNLLTLASASLLTFPLQEEHTTRQNNQTRRYFKTYGGK